MKSIADLNREIREFINDTPRKQCILLHDKAIWNLLYSCLDTIDDTELAIDAHASTSASSDSGDAYLLIYGVLQALFIQQDAVENLCQALNIACERDPLLARIREIRNNSVGHPTKRGKGAGDAYNFISRLHLSKDSFRLRTEYANGRPPLSEDIRIESIVAGQRSALHQVLSKVMKKLRREEAEHRAQYRDKRLQEVFPATLGYYFEKTYEAIHGSKPASYGGYHIELVADVLDAFQERLRERGILTAYDSVDYQIQLLEYPISRLKAYFDDPSGNTINAEDAFIFVFFTERHLDKLKEMAAEIDATYDTEP